MANEEPGTEAQVRLTTPARNGPQWAVDAKERVQAASRRSSRPLADRGAMDANEADIASKVTPTPVAPADVKRIRAELVDAGIAARRWLERLRWARLLIAAAVQVGMVIIAWRIWVWRGRPRLK
jgi:hypothetical protein